MISKRHPPSIVVLRAQAGLIDLGEIAIFMDMKGGDLPSLLAAREYIQSLIRQCPVKTATDEEVRP